ncbi:MAG: DsbA family oxidoreductase [Micropepsaceae bacterium]
MSILGSMQIDVISDTVCPWCYIGKRRLERAIRLRPQIEFQVRWRPFQLDPTTPPEGVDRKTYIERKFGSSDKIKPIHAALLKAGDDEGINFAFEKIARTPNTINSHRLIRWSQAMGFQDALVERLFKAYFTEGADIGQIDVLKRLGADAGMDPELVEDLLNTDIDLEKVQHEDSMARKIGISGVPTFLIGGKILVNGAQDAEHLAHVIDRVAAGDEEALATA